MEMNYSQELAREFRSAQNTFIYYLISANIAIIGFLFTQIDIFNNSIEFYLLLSGFMSLIISIAFSAVYLSHGMRWFQVVVNKAKINILYSDSKTKIPAVTASLKLHEQELDRIAEKMSACFNRSIISLISGIALVLGWKMMTLF